MNLIDVEPLFAVMPPVPVFTFAVCIFLIEWIESSLTKSKIKQPNITLRSAQVNYRFGIRRFNPLLTICSQTIIRSSFLLHITEPIISRFTISYKPTTYRSTSSDYFYSFSGISSSRLNYISLFYDSGKSNLATSIF